MSDKDAVLEQYPRAVENRWRDDSVFPSIGGYTIYDPMTDRHVGASQISFIEAWRHARSRLAPPQAQEAAVPDLGGADAGKEAAPLDMCWCGHERETHTDYGCVCETAQDEMCECKRFVLGSIESGLARKITTHTLNRPSGDPDDDLAVVSRHLFRADEFLAESYRQRRSIIAERDKLREENEHYRKLLLTDANLDALPATMEDIPDSEIAYRFEYSPTCTCVHCYIMGHIVRLRAQLASIRAFKVERPEVRKINTLYWNGAPFGDGLYSEVTLVCLASEVAAALDAAEARIAELEARLSRSLGQEPPV